MHDHLILEFKSPGVDGLCLLHRKLHRNDLITEDEFDRIDEYLQINLPKISYYVHGGYCWTRNDIKFRMEWLEEQIDKLKKKRKKYDV